ncbi:hypothetical protein NEQG_00450 [Nematocida parisii ERTm3]|uniref:Uncharacterized protein n=1 Tax=Nematocida parisii (strain ERTm3) TaxID=935791 RepID=I3EKD3_NEMP3|nr:hypothetical protein NEQG_00450 [Nematocida parisii ERTm3]
MRKIRIFSRFKENSHKTIKKAPEIASPLKKDSEKFCICRGCRYNSIKPSYSYNLLYINPRVSNLYENHLYFYGPFSVLPFYYMHLYNGFHVKRNSPDYFRSFGGVSILILTLFILFHAIPYVFKYPEASVLLITLVCCLHSSIFIQILFIFVVYTFYTLFSIYVYSILIPISSDTGYLICLSALFMLLFIFFVQTSHLPLTRR